MISTEKGQCVYGRKAHIPLRDVVVKAEKNALSLSIMYLEIPAFEIVWHGDSESERDAERKREHKDRLR